MVSKGDTRSLDNGSYVFTQADFAVMRFFV